MYGDQQLKKEKKLVLQDSQAVSNTMELEIESFTVAFFLFLLNILQFIYSYECWNGVWGSVVGRDTLELLIKVESMHHTTL